VKEDMWTAVVEGIQPKIDGNILRLVATQNLRARKGKILKERWFRAIRKNTQMHPNYAIHDGIRNLTSPDGKDFSRKAFFLIIGDKGEKAPEYIRRLYYVSSLIAGLMKRVGFLCGISTADEVGVFGIWPAKFYEICERRPDLMVVAQVLLADCPDFWERVQIIVSPAMRHLLGKR